MKKTITLLLILSALLSTLNSLASVNVSGSISSDSTWKTGDVIIVVGDITIEQGITLTIEPGVIIKFNGIFSIYINGTLFADGTNTNKITFTSNSATPAAGNWAGIVLNGNGTSASTVLNYCVFNYATNPLTVNGMTTSNSLNLPTLSNLTIDKISGTGITFTGSTLGTFVVQNIDIGATSPLTIGISANNSTVNIQNATMRNFSNYGLYATNYSSIQIQGSTITQIVPAKFRTGSGIYANYGSNVIVTGCTISYCDNGIYALDDNYYNPTLSISNNLITQNNQGLYVYCGHPSWPYPNVTVTGNDFTQNVSWNAYSPNTGVGYSTYEYNMTGNYWGTTDGPSIAAKIYDYSDNAGVAMINYLPFLNASKSAGGIPTSLNYLSGWLHSDSTLTKTGSPYVVIGQLFVENAKTLTIEAGVTVKFESYSVNVNGTLIANGAINDRIIFTSNKATPAAGNWSGISLNANGTSESSLMNYCVINYATNALTVNNMTATNSLKLPSLSNIAIDKISGTGITFSGSTLGTFVLQNLDIGATTALVTGISMDNSKVQIQNATIRNFSNEGIYATNNSIVEIQGSTTTQIFPAKFRTGNGVTIKYASTATITGSTISYCDNGIYAMDDNNVRPTLLITNNLLTQNNQGITIYNAYPSYNYPDITATGNDIRQNLSWNVYSPYQGVGYSTREFNMTGNYWGTTDGPSIAAKIYDYSDNAGVAMINYLPFLNASKDAGGTPTSLNYLSGWIHKDSTLTKTGSPYIVIGQVIVEENKTLTIDAGTTIKFETNEINVNGTLLVNGTSSEKIIFTSNKAAPVAGNWNGIILNGNGTSASTILNYCVFNYATNALNVNSMTFTNSLNLPSLSNLVIDKISGTGIIFTGSTLDTFLVQNIDIGATAALTTGISINNSIVKIKNATVRNFSDYGIFVANYSSARIEGSTLTQIIPAKYRTGNGILVKHGSNAVITGSSISYCDNGIYAMNDNNILPTLLITNNLITQNNQGIFNYVPYSSWNYPDITASGNDIWQNLGWNVYSPYSGVGYLTREFNMTGNYWGTIDGPSIAAKIYDYNENAGVAMINFLPFLNASKDAGGTPTSLNYLSGWIHQDSILTLAGSPYVVIGQVIVENSKTLTIEPLTTIKFEAYAINVNGTLLAKGTGNNNLVTFTSNKSTPAAGNWTGIVLNANNIDNPSQLDFAKIEYADNGININNINASTSIGIPSISNAIINNSNVGIYAYNSFATLSKVFLRNFTNQGIYITGTSSDITISDNNVITQDAGNRVKTATGIYVENGGKASISGSAITSCNNGIQVHNGNGNKPTASVISSIISKNNQGVYVTCNNGGWDFPSISVNNSDVKDNTNWNVQIPNSGLNPSNTNLNFTNNFWNLSDSAAIDDKIYDYYNNNGVAKTIITPFSAARLGEYNISDVNSDGRTDGFDLSGLASAFGLSSIDAGYNSNADLNSSGRVDGFDLAIFGVNFGEYGVGLLPKKSFTYSYNSSQIIDLTLKLDPTDYNVGDTLQITVYAKNALPLYAFAASFSFDENLMKFIRFTDGGFISNNGISEIFRINNCKSGKGYLGISRIGNQDTAYNQDEGLIAVLYFIAKNPISNSSIMGLTEIGLLAPDGITQYAYSFINGTSTSITEKKNTEPSLMMQNFPNPFKTETTIQIHLAEPEHIQLIIYDGTGRKISELVNDELQSGNHSFPFYAEKLAGGVYYYQLKTKSFISTKKMELLR